MTTDIAPISVGSCPTCGGPAQVIAQPGTALRHRHIHLPDLEDDLGGGWRLSGIEWLAVEAQAGKPAWVARGWDPTRATGGFEQVVGETPSAAYLALRTAIERRS